MLRSRRHCRTETYTQMLRIVLYSMSRVRPTNLDLKMHLIARQDFEAGRTSKKTELSRLDSSVLVLYV